MKILFFSSSAAVAAISSEECSSASSQAVDNVPTVQQIKAQNVPHSNTLISPDRTVRYNILITLFSF